VSTVIATYASDVNCLSSKTDEALTSQPYKFNTGYAACRQYNENSSRNVEVIFKTFKIALFAIMLA